MSPGRFPAHQFPATAARGHSLRIGDIERSTACDLLTAHYCAGRLDDQELEKRIESAVAARQTSDLWPLFFDLPSLRPGAHRQLGPSSGQSTTLVARTIAWLIAFLAVGICVPMVIGMLIYEPAIGLAAIFGGVVAAVGGGAFGWLIARRSSTHGQHRT